MGRHCKEGVSYRHVGDTFTVEVTLNMTDTKIVVCFCGRVHHIQ